MVGGRGEPETTSSTPSVCPWVMDGTRVCWGPSMSWLVSSWGGHALHPSPGSASSDYRCPQSTNSLFPSLFPSALASTPLEKPVTHTLTCITPQPRIRIQVHTCCPFPRGPVCSTTMCNTERALSFLPYLPWVCSLDPLCPIGCRCPLATS